MTAFLSLLGAMWSVGCVIAPLGAASSLLLNREYLVGVLILLIGLPLAVLIAAVPWMIAADTNSPTLATLKKGEWACSATRTETTMMPITSGKTITMVPTTHSFCTAYVRTN